MEILQNMDTKKICSKISRRINKPIQKVKTVNFRVLVNRLCTREILTYLVSGVLTTLVNWILYFIIVHLVFKGTFPKTLYGT